MKVMITGAHFTPAQAVIEELHKFRDSSASPQNDRGVEIVYVGRKYTQEGDTSLSQESQILPKLGVKFIPIIAGRLRRFISVGTILSLFKIPIGFIQSFYFVVKENPDVVLSFGGYIGLPVVVSAWLLSKPIIIHEQTLISGLTNTISSIFADKIALSFIQKDFKSSKIVLTGNPLRGGLLINEHSQSSEISEFLVKAKNQKLKIIYVTGGNQGSHIINQTISEALAKLSNSFVVIHQTGDSKYNDFDKLQILRSGLLHPDRYLVRKWFEVEELRQILTSSNLVVSRAGANTLYEFAYFSIPTIVIPIPYLYKDEQTVNARFFSDLGLCEIIYQKQFDQQRLLDKVAMIFKNYHSFRNKAKNARKIVDLDAAKKITQETLILGDG